MQIIKLFEEYHEDPRFKDPLGFIKGFIEEYQTILTDENPIRLYNISYQTHFGDLIHLPWERRWRQVLMDYIQLPPGQNAERRREFDKDIKNLNYRIKVHIVLKVELKEAGRTLHSVGNKGRKISLPTPSKPQRLHLLPAYQEFMDRISSELENFFIVEDEDANKYCQTSDEDYNILDNRMVYFYPKGSKALNNRE